MFCVMEQKSLLQETKSEIRCLLISSALQMTVKALGDDYRNFTGKSIPFTQLGFRNLYDFLNTIPDVVQITGNDPRFAIVTPIVTKNLENLNSLIMKQKNSTVNSKRNNMMVRHRRTTVTGVNAFYNRKSTVAACKKTSNDISSSSSNKSYSERDVKITNSSEQHQSNFSPTVLYNLNNKQKQLESKVNEKSFEILSMAKISDESIEDDIRNSNVISHPDLTHHISDKIRNNLKELIKEFPHGLPMASLALHYERKFENVLSYTELGFPNAIEFFVQLPDIFWIDRLSKFGDFILFDVNQKHSINIKALQICENESKDIEDERSVSPDLTITEISKICNIKQPSDMMGPGDVIENVWATTSFEKKRIIRVVITEVYDPTKFWFVIDDEDHFVLMNKTMDQMQEFYEKHQASLKISNLEERMYCAICYCTNWQRGYIIRILGDNKVKVFFIDYGSVIITDVSTIRYLGKAFQKTPQQVLRGRLDFVIPKNNANFWDLHICKFFVKQIQERRLLCLITDVDLKDQVIWMTLTDFENHKKNKKCLTINEILVAKDYADICSDSKCFTKPYPGNCRIFMDYLLPLFVDLENGYTYTYTELLRFQKKGLMHETIMLETLRLLKQRYHLVYDIDLQNNNFNNCGHFVIKHFKQAETKEELKWLQELEYNATPYCNDFANIRENVYQPQLSESDYEEFEHLRVYNVGGHELYCTVVNYRVYVVTDEFIKKFMPKYSIEDVTNKMNMLGLKCRNINITIKSHPDIFLELQRANIPIEVKTDTVLQLTPLRSLDLILYTFKIPNSKLSEDIENIYKEVAS